MKTAKWACVISLMAVSVLGSYGERSHAQLLTGTKAGLSDPSHEAQFNAVLDSGTTYWDKGYLITLGLHGTLEASPSTAALIVYDREGQIAREPVIWIEGAKMVTVGSAAINQSGKLVVTAGALDAKGGIATFIGEVGADDRLRNIIRITPFAPAYVCVAGDGTVWSYGMDRDEHLNGVQGSLRLRHYSFEKGQLEALLDVTKLPDYETNREAWRTTHFAPNEVDLRCNSKTVVLYNSKSGDLLEFDLQQNKMTVTKMPLPPDHCPAFCISGFALTESGEIFASLLDRKGHDMPVSGLFRLTRKNGTAEWVAIPGAVGRYPTQTARFPNESPVHTLFGADGEDLVYAKRLDGRLYWSKASSE